jgi:hypothetical protein
MTEIKSWGVCDLEPFISTASGKRFAETYLNRVWREWWASDETAPIRDLRMSIHGLRATKINDLRRVGTEDGAIADEIGMSVRWSPAICDSPTREHRPAPAVTGENGRWRI